VNVLTLESKKAESVKQWMAFRVKPRRKENIEEARKRPPKWNAFNLIPTAETHSEARAQAAYHKMICYLVCDGVPSETIRLYEDVPFSQVWEMYGLKKASSW
jgi:hypothetical protein